MRGRDADHNPRTPIRSSLPHTKGSKCDVNMGVALAAAHRQAHRQAEWLNILYDGRLFTIEVC